ncbi:MAG: hypothetical protein ABFD00_10495 [Chloroherpetonaceae bacterium]
MINWNLQTINIKDLKEHPKNPRQIGKEQFARLGNLIDKFGLIDKPIVNTDMTLIGGHQRIKYLKKQKQKTTQCWMPDRELNEKEVEELLIGMNKIHGQFDFDLLANHFEPLELLNWGFSEKELFDNFQHVEENLENSTCEEKSKKSKLCPACGHEF